MTDLREMGEAVENALLDGVGRVAARVQENRPLAADVLESDDAYMVVFDAPGTEREDVEVDYEAGVVEVHVERFREFREGVEMRAPGRALSLHGRAELPEGASVDATGASATLTDSGTLQVVLPKRDEASADDDHEAEDDAEHDEADADEGEHEEEEPDDEDAA